MANVYMCTKITSFMFLTAMAGNGLAIEFMGQIAGVKLNWIEWAYAFLVPGIIMLAFTPILTYIIEKPTITKVDNKKIAEDGLAELGPMSLKEKLLLGIFVLALLGWGLPSMMTLIGVKFNIDATAVAVAAMVLLLLTGVLTWEDMLKNKGGWQTLIWFGGIIGLSSTLVKMKFFSWVGTLLEASLDFGGNATLAFWGIVFVSIVVRYIFASATAYIAALIPVFLMLGKIAGIDMMLLCLSLGAANSYGGAVTHYGGPAAPIIFGTGYNTVKKWWIVGAVFAVMCYLVTMLVAPIWWKMIGMVG